MELTVINEHEQTYHTYIGVSELYVDGDISFSCYDEFTQKIYCITITADKYTSFRLNKG